jgi:hypothetical protein
MMMRSPAMISLRKRVLGVPMLRNAVARMAIKDIETRAETHSDPNVRDLLSTGYSEMPDFLTEDECAQVVEFMRDLERKNRDAGYEYDRRFWITREIPVIEPMKRFMDSAKLKKIAEDYLGTTVVNDVMLANIVRNGGQNLGSGNGWHRDGTRRGVKAILYVVDVTPDNGALTIVSDSFRKSDIIGDSKRYGLNPFDVTLRDPNYNKRIDTLLTEQPSRKKSFTGKRGTVFFFETRSLHRGLPILKTGERYALTNYYEDASRPTVEKKRAAQGVLLKT